MGIAQCKCTDKDAGKASEAAGEETAKVADDDPFKPEEAAKALQNEAAEKELAEVQPAAITADLSSPAVDVSAPSEPVEEGIPKAEEQAPLPAAEEDQKEEKPEDAPTAAEEATLPAAEEEKREEKPEEAPKAAEEADKTVHKKSEEEKKKKNKPEGSKTTKKKAESANKKEDDSKKAEDKPAVEEKKIDKGEELRNAAMAGDDKTVSKLMKEGKTNINAGDEDGVTALMIASEKGWEEIVGRLSCAKGVKVNSKTMQNKDTALHVACREGHKDIAVMLVRAGSDLKAKNKQGKIPAEIAKESDLAAWLRGNNPAGTPPPWQGRKLK